MSYEKHRLSSKRANRTRERLLARDGNRCSICGAPFDPSLEGTGKEGTMSIDHIPLRAGGTHDDENLRLAHRSCNRRRDERELTVA